MISLSFILAIYHFSPKNILSQWCRNRSKLRNSLFFNSIADIPLYIFRASPRRRKGILKKDLSSLCMNWLAEFPRDPTHIDFARSKPKCWPMICKAKMAGFFSVMRYYAMVYTWLRVSYRKIYNDISILNGFQSLYSSRTCSWQLSSSLESFQKLSSELPY